MKKLFFTAVAMFATVALFAAMPVKPTNVDKLPVKAHDFIHKYFALDEVRSVNELDDDHHKLYVVEFKNGDVVHFDYKTGECVAIKLKQGAVPMSLISSKVRASVESHYPGVSVTSIARDGGVICLGLSNGKTLCYDKDGNIKQSCDKSKHCGRANDTCCERRER